MARETAIRGRVLHLHQPVAGAYVTLLGAAGEFVGEVRSDDLGHFQLYAIPGEWTLTCLVPGAARQTRPVTLGLGEEKEVEFGV